MLNFKKVHSIRMMVISWSQLYDMDQGNKRLNLVKDPDPLLVIVISPLFILISVKRKYYINW